VLQYLRMFGLILIVSAIMPSHVAFASDDQPDDIVLLTNGGIVQGKIVERVGHHKIVVELPNGRRIDIPLKRISSITNSAADYTTRHQAILDSLNAVRNQPLAVVGTTMQIHVGALTSTKLTAVGLSGSVAMMTNRNFSLGVSAGWNRYPKGNLLPVLCEFEYRMSHGFWQPLLFLHAGIAGGWRKGRQGADYGGPRYGLGIGLLKVIHEGLAVTVRIGFEHQSVTNMTNELDSYPELVESSLGISF
jgi:hypothetical protein